METQTIKILGIEAKSSESGTKYWTVKTDLGNVNCFEESIVDQLNLNKSYHAIIAKNERDGKTFMNLRKLVTIPEEKIEKETKETKKDIFTEAREEKNRSFRAAYAKDIFISFLENREKLEFKDLTSREILGEAIKAEKFIWNSLDFGDFVKNALKKYGDLENGKDS